MMIGVFAVVGRVRSNRQTSRPPSTGKVEVEDDQVRRLLAGELQRLIAARRDLDDGVAAAFERVFDQAGDVAFVFDDQHASLVETARRVGAS